MKDLSCHEFDLCLVNDMALLEGFKMEMSKLHTEDLFYTFFLMFFIFIFVTKRDRA